MEKNYLVQVYSRVNSIITAGRFPTEREARAFVDALPKGGIYAEAHAYLAYQFLRGADEIDTTIGKWVNREGLWIELPIRAHGGVVMVSP